MDNIPGKSRKEWQELLTGEINVKLENFVLQMKVDQTKRAIQSSNITIDQGVAKIYDLCVKYSLAVKKDMETIFNQ